MKKKEFNIIMHTLGCSGPVGHFRLEQNNYAAFYVWNNLALYHDQNDTVIVLGHIPLDLNYEILQEEGGEKFKIVSQSLKDWNPDRVSTMNDNIDPESFITSHYMHYSRCYHISGTKEFIDFVCRIQDYVAAKPNYMGTYIDKGELENNLATILYMNLDIAISKVREGVQGKEVYIEQGKSLSDSTLEYALRDFDNAINPYQFEERILLNVSKYMDKIDLTPQTDLDGGKNSISIKGDGIETVVTVDGDAVLYRYMGRVDEYHTLKIAHSHYKTKDYIIIFEITTVPGIGSKTENTFLDVQSRKILTDKVWREATDEELMTIQNALEKASLHSANTILDKMVDKEKTIDFKPTEHK